MTAAPCCEIGGTPFWFAVKELSLRDLNMEVWLILGFPYYSNLAQVPEQQPGGFSSP